MRRPFSSQPTSSRASTDVNRAESSRHSASSSNGRAAASRQQPEEDQDAARRARRRRRMEEDAYHVRGWEDLYRGDGSRPVFANDPKPSSRNRATASSSQTPSTNRERPTASSSQPLARPSRETSSSTRRIQASTQASSSRTTSSQQAPPSTAPTRSYRSALHATSSRLKKRKATSPTSQPSPTKKLRAPYPSQRQPTPEASDGDSSGDDFEITGVSGPALTRFAVDEHPKPSVKASPSPLGTPKSSQPTQSAALRRSASRAPSAGRLSPAPPRLLAGNDRHSSSSAPPSRASSQPRASRAPSSTSSTGPAKLSPQDIEALSQAAYDAFVQGSSLADHIGDVVRDYSDMLSPSHGDRPKVEQFQQKLAHLGPQLTIRYLREVMPTLPPRLAKRFGPSLAAYIQYIKRDWGDEQDSAEQSNDNIPALDAAAAESIAAIASTNDLDSEKVSEQMESVRSPAGPAIAALPSLSVVEETGPVEASGAGSSGLASEASNQAPPQAAKEPSSSSAAIEAEPIDEDPTHDPETAPAQAAEPEPDVADSSRESALDSTSSPQAFGTPPEQPDDEGEEDHRHDQQEPQEPPMLEAPRHREEREEQRQRAVHEKHDESEQSEDEEEEQDESQGQHHGQHSNEHGHEEEEDELVDELDDDDQNRSITQAQGVEQVLHQGDASAVSEDGMLGAPPTKALEQHDIADDGEEEAQAAREGQPNNPENGDVLQGQSTDRNAQQAAAADAHVGTLETQVADASGTSHPAASEPTEVNRPQTEVEGVEQTTSDRQDAQQQPSPQQANSQQEPDSDVASNAAAGDEQADATLIQASDSSKEPARAEEFNDVTIDDLDAPADPTADRVATAVEAVEQALAAESDMHPADPNDEAVLASGTSVTAADSPMQEDDPAKAPSHQDPASDASSPPVAASEARAVATPPVPSRSSSAEPEAEAVAATAETGDAMSDASPVQAEPQPSAEAEAPQPVASTSAAPLEAADADTRDPPVPAAMVAVSDLNAASAAAEAVPDQVEQPSCPPIADDTAQQDDPTEAAEHGEAPGALVVPAAADIDVDGNPAQPSRNLERASSQAGSDTTTATRPKMTIDDRMKSLLKDLAKAKGKKKSSYRAIQKLKPRRAGFGSSKTIRDLVEHWQDPAKMIPWTCLQELGPTIFHKRAHEHMHLDVHTIADRLSNTRPVQFVRDKVPERVIARALMEFPRVPHMLHCWNEEKTKYFASRGLPQPTDTKPEFRYADAQGAGISSPRLLEVPNADSQHSRSSSSPLPVQSMTQSRPVRSPTTAQPANSHAQATTAAYHSGPSQQGAAARSVAPLPTRTLPQVGSQQLAAQLAQMATMAPGNLAQHPRQVAAMPPVPLRLLPPQHVAMPQAVQLQQQQQLQQQLQQTQLSANAIRAAMIKEATERVFSGLAADCLSFAEQVVGSPATDELAMRPHFSEADVLHVLNFVADTYQREAETERRSGRNCAKAEEHYAKVLRVRSVALDVIALTRMLNRVKMCLNEAAIESLRRTGVASAEHWLDHLNTAPKWDGVKQYLLRGEQGVAALSRAESNMLLQRQVDRLNKRLEGLLESLMSIDGLVGGRVSGVERAREEEEAQEVIRNECEGIGRICCKHVVGILVGDSEGR